MKTAGRGPILISLLIAQCFNLLSQSDPVKVDLVSNGNKLNALFYTSNDKYSPTLVLLHGFPGNNESPLGLAEKLNATGIKILVFNYQGSFSSEGFFSNRNCIHDIVVAMNFLKLEKTILQFEIDTSKIVLCGHSLGGGFALTAAVHHPEIRRIISIGGPDNSVYIKKMKTVSGYRETFEQNASRSFSPNGPINLDLESFHRYNDSLILNVDYYDLVKNAEKLRDREILFIAGWLDNTASIEENVLPIYRRLKQLNSEKVNITAFDTNHGFSNVKDDLIKVIVDWTRGKMDLP
jgi:pimeloyl-ACP methyl ester carboxylesterase